MSNSTTNCIYRIYCTSTKQSYIGQTIHAEKRWSQHIAELRTGKHHNHKLQDAFWKYGETCLQFEIIEDNLEADNLTNREAYWMKEYKGYGDGLNVAYVGHPNGKPDVAVSQRPKEIAPPSLAIVKAEPQPTPTQPELKKGYETFSDTQSYISEQIRRGLHWYDEAQRLRIENQKLMRENGMLRWRLGERFDTEIDTDEQVIA
jgi:hypothetical protein